MRYAFFLLSIFIFKFPIYSQDKFNNVWVLGYNPNDSLAGYGGTILDFKTVPPTVSYFPIPIDANNTAQICSKEGDFLFFSNGCKIINAEQELIVNGDQINPGPFHDEWCNTGDDHAYETRQGMIALPWPGHDNEYAMFHLGWYRTPNWPPRNYLQDYYVTRINMNGLCCMNPPICWATV